MPKQALLRLLNDTTSNQQSPDAARLRLRIFNGIAPLAFFADNDIVPGMNFRPKSAVVFLLLASILPAFSAPVIDPIPNASIPAGKSLIIPVTATSPNGLPLTFTATTSTNRITVQVHTNNPFWKMTVDQAAPAGAPGSFLTPFRGTMLNVTNIGDMTFMLFRDIAPHSVDVIQGLTASGMYTTNTIFHRVIAGFMDQGGDPATNGTGGPVFRYNDEFNPSAIFSGSGQLALANTGKDTDGSQFFVTVAPYRYGDFGYTIFGQLLRGFNVLSSINNTPTDANNRPLADVIIAQTSIVPDNFDTVLTLTGTNHAGISGTIKVVADDGVGGRTTNSFTATTVADTTVETPFIYPNTATNLVTPVNTRLTNNITAYDFPGVTNNWLVQYGDLISSQSATNSYYITASNHLQFVVVPNANYTGHFSLIFFVSATPGFATYDLQEYTFAIGDSAIEGSATNFTTQAFVPVNNEILATFTNGVPSSSVTNFAAFINWGDNSISSGTITQNTQGQKQILGSHTYVNPGDYPVYITIPSYFGASSTLVCTSSVPPSLGLLNAGANNILSWPAWATAYQLQSNPNLAASGWLATTNNSTLSGYSIVVSNSLSGSGSFFRLKK